LLSYLIALSGTLVGVLHCTSVNADKEESIAFNLWRLGGLVGYASYSLSGETGLHVDGEEGEDQMVFPPANHGRRGEITEAFELAGAEVSTKRPSEAARA